MREGSSGELGSSSGEAGSTTTGSADGTSDGGPLCIPGQQVACTCTDGNDGSQVCNADGDGYEPCACDPVETTGPSVGCGDQLCIEELGEDCSTCPEDCGECLVCNDAPSCANRLVPPEITEHADNLDDVQMAFLDPVAARARLLAAVARDDMAMRLLAAALDEPHPDEHALIGALRQTFVEHPGPAAAVRRQLAQAGMVDPRAYRLTRPEPRRAEIDALAGTPTPLAADACADPRLRIRIATLDVFEEDDDVFNDEIYCVVSSEGTEASEIHVTPITLPLDGGTTHEYSLGEGLVWGQADLVAPKGNLLLTYDCIESDTDSGYVDLLNAIGSAASVIGYIAGPGGWIFSAVGVVASMVATALAADGDDLLFNGSQAIPSDLHLALTQGRYWLVRRSGTHINSDWDWQLRMEVWGCHDNAPG